MRQVLLGILIFVLAACVSRPATPIRSADYGENIKGQPPFPALINYWVIDNGCGFTQEAKKNAFKVFEALNRDHIAQVAVVCQTGVKGGPSEASTWISEWLNHEGLGSMQDKRAVAVLIRPDVNQSDFRITINPNDEIYWFTPSDEYEIKHEAGDYANYNDFNGCLASLVRNLDVYLRAKWKVYGPTAVP